MFEILEFCFSREYEMVKMKVFANHIKKKNKIILMKPTIDDKFEDKERFDQKRDQNALRKGKKGNILFYFPFSSQKPLLSFYK